MTLSAARLPLTRYALFLGLAAAAPALALAATGEPPPAFSATVADSGADAYAKPFPGLPGTQSEAFHEGRVLFRQAWLMPPASDDADFVGLGPVYNDISCLGCHVRNGRGAAPEAGAAVLHGLLVRLSIPGSGPHGGPNPTPAYGDQLNDHAIPGVPAEGEPRITYTPKTVTLGDGTRVELRTPKLALVNLRFGALMGRADGAGGRMLGAMTSARVAQPVFGLGLLASLPQSEIEDRAARLHARGGPTHGHINMVWDIALGKTVMGRFGWKANQPTLAQQSAGAANGDMGLTSPLFPAKNCPPVQTECLAAPRGPDPNLSAARLTELTRYLEALAVPARRHPGDPAVRRGEALFARMGCEDCHASRWTTGPLDGIPGMAGREIAPYTDLLVHDMGGGLADDRPDFQANGREWRTPPLWGIGLAQVLNDRAGFLHDGRARTLTEAILWHGGEASFARHAFSRASALDRSDLLAFLNDL